MLKLKRPIIFFDIESTGLDISKDRIIEISLIKINPDGSKESKTRRINPTIPIPAVSTAIHGIHDEDVTLEPVFASVARSLAEWMKGCDLAGYNSNKFDIPILAEEFARAGVEFDFSRIKFVDVQNIFHKMEQRTLSAAYKFYCGKSIENAHSAQADVMATYEVLLAQIDRYDELADDIDFLSDFSKMGRNVDLAGRIVLNENDVPVFNFGKYKGVAVEEVFGREPSYYDWLMKGDFAQNTKQVATQIRLKPIVIGK
ncbi:MAG: exonuclease domain-containing protein [Mucinivorans sp.]